MRKFNRHNLFCVMIMLLSVLIITISFSWFTRPNGSANAHSLQLNGVTATIKSESSTATTYKSSFSNGLLVTDTTAVNTTDSIVIPAGGSQYFTTTVTNTSSANTNLSLNGLTLTGATGAQINMLYPVKNTSIYSNNMIVAEHLTVKADETVNVDWYIYNPTTADITVKFTSLPQIDYYE